MTAGGILKSGTFTTSGMKKTPAIPLGGLRCLVSRSASSQRVCNNMSLSSATGPSSWSDEYLLSQAALGMAAFADAQRWQAILTELHNRGLGREQVDSFRERGEANRAQDRSISLQLWISVCLFCFGIAATLFTYWFGSITARLLGSSRFYYGIWFGAVLAGAVGIMQGLHRLWRRRTGG